MWSRLGAVVALTAGMFVMAAPAAHAQDPVDLAGAYVLDTVGAISGDEAGVQAALDSLYEHARIQLFVVYVDSFSNPSDPIDWADGVADSNGLGTDDLLLAVALDDRQYAISVAPGFTKLSTSQLDDVESVMQDALRDNDWAGAAINGAGAIEAAATGVVGPNVPQLPGDEGDPVPAAGISPVVPIVGGVAVVGIGVFVFSRIRRRNREGAATSAPDQMTQKQLDQRAGTLLVQLDDSVKTSEQELGFAVAQFGDAATADFTATLKSAQAKVTQAFTLKQQLDDAQPDTDADTRSWTTQIIQLCEAADAELDAQADAFDALRQLEKNAPQALTEVRAQAAAATERATTASAALASLESAYAAGAVKPVADNVTQAQKLLVFAGTAAKQAEEAIAAGKASDAAIAVRTAQSSVGQTTQLFDAIDALGMNLKDASDKLAAAVEDTENDIAAAKALPADGDSLAPAIASAASALAAAKSALDDPVRSLEPLQSANSALDSAFSSAQERVAAVTRAKSQLDATLAGARAQVTAAMEYISTRRGGIGETARTRVSEADRHLTQAAALASSDPVAALAEAQQAADLADRALQLARADVDGYRAQENFNNNPSSSGYNGSDGADLGGILGGWFGGGSGGSSGRSTWSGGSSNRSSSRSSSSRSSRSGSFGGSSRSSSRSSGGGRSRGGRF